MSLLKPTCTVTKAGYHNIEKSRSLAQGPGPYSPKGMAFEAF